MDSLKVAVFLFSIVLLTGFSIGYTGSSGDGGGGGVEPTSEDATQDDGGDEPGDGGGGTDPGDKSPGSCYNGVDDDGDGFTDDGDGFSGPGDLGCVDPSVKDEIEGNIWDTDLTTSLSGENPSRNADESVFFSGSIMMGNDFQTRPSGDSEASGSLDEKNIVDMGSEVGTDYGNADNNFYSYGRSNNLNYDNFPTGSAFKNDRVIDPPNPGTDITGVTSSDIEGSEQSCGDGYENDGGWENCKPDHGNLSNDNLKPADISGEPAQTTECDDDGALDKDQTQAGSCSCGGSSSSCTEGDVYWDSSGVGNQDEDNKKYYWTTADDQTLSKQECGETSSSTTTADSKDYQSGCTEKCSGTINSTTGACEGGSFYCDSSTNTCSGDSMTRQDRDHSQVDSYDCNLKNEVYGGGENNADDGSNNKPDNDAAGTFVDHRATTEGDESRDYCEPEETLTIDADGPQGKGDGFVVIHDGSIIATESPNGSNSVGIVHYGYDGSIDSTSNMLNSKVSSSCDNNKNTCLKYVDFQTDPDDWGYNLGSSTISDGVEVDASQTETYTADESYSVCKNINRINEKNGNGQDELIDCDYERGETLGDTGGPHDVSPLPEACGDEPDEHLIQMEGPEVDEEVVQNNGLAYAQECVDWGEDTGGFGNSLTADACVRNGTAYSEGTVVNIARGDVDGYEEGGDSPDWEVCADVPGAGDELPWDNGEDNQGTDFGGEWHDLDSQSLQQYVRNNPGILNDDSSDLGSNGDPNRLSYYWRNNPNPNHPEYNPQGGNDGTALENDCGPNVEGCNDEDNSGSTNKNPTFFAFLNDGEGTYDEDYSPQGGSVSGDVFEENSFFDPAGRLNRLQEDTDQIEPGMDTTFPRLDTTDIWSDSVGGRDEADMFALTQSLEWSISNRGVPYSPGSAPYHEDYTGLKRSGPEDATVPKESKVFGNSMAVVAARDFNPVDGPEQIESGEGYWIEPDDIRSEEGNYRSNWENVLNYQFDITGPDAGLGFHTDGMASPVFDNEGNIVNTDIFFEGEPSSGSATASNTNEYLEPPMCGDDQREYLLEERGETKNSAAFNGTYACADARDHCVQRDYAQKLYNPGAYLQANEAAEDVGRLKQDEEYCAERPADNFPNWYDQDYGDVDGDGEQETCRENTLYGDAGVRWFSETDVEEHPNAFTGGIDDDSNPDLENDGVATLTSRPEADSWNDAETPVSSGELTTPNPDRRVATKGFCGGDDASEYMVTQTCETRFCETDNSIIGVVEDPDQCILDQDEVDGVSGAERDLYQQGDTVDVDTGSDVKTIACYNGAWYEDWPVVFLRDSTEVPLGTTDRVSFQIINIQEDAKTFDLELSIGNNDMDSLTTFTETGTNEMTVDVGGSNSETYSVEIRGNTIIENPKNIELQAESRDGSLEGFDTLEASVLDNNVTAVGNTTQERRDIPGIGLTQIVWLVMSASAIYFFKGRNL